jgi:hypothetical protein
LTQRLFLQELARRGTALDKSQQNGGTFRGLAQLMTHLTLHFDRRRFHDLLKELIQHLALSAFAIRADR